MSEAGFGDVLHAVKALDGYTHPWAVCGGWAVDLFLDRITRPHKDVDFIVLRKDQLVLQKQLLSKGWTLEKAANGQLIPWEGNEWLDLPVHIIWCRNSKASPDFIEILFDTMEGDKFLYRRNPSITFPAEKAIISSPLGVPILAPEIVLLYKSGKPEDPSAMSDFKNVSARLTVDSRHWLAAALRKTNPEHVWLNALR
jgi:hypothetical protein